MTTAELTLGLVTLFAYSATCLISIQFARNAEPLRKWPLLVPGLIGLISNICLTATLGYHEGGAIINFSSTMSLFSAALSCIGTTSILSDRSRIIGAFTYPIAAIMIALVLFTFDNSTQPSQLSLGVLAHVAFSLLAYGLLTLTMAQAVAIFYQIRALKFSEHRTLIRVLPPLQTMEKLLFVLLRFGWLTLTLAIASGWFFVDNLFTQHLTHKTTLTLFSWLIFGILIVGHIKYGWRGTKAVVYVSAGFLLLLLAYFGSKFVLEIVLNR